MYKRQLLRLLTQRLSSEDQGSIGVRFEMYSVSWQLFFNNPLFGVGLGNWHEFSGFDNHLYPHNVLLEILAEGGLFLFLVFFTTFVYIFKNTSEVGRYILILCLLLTSFSGDLSYLRFLLVFPLAFIWSGSRDPRFASEDKI